VSNRDLTRDAEVGEVEEREDEAAGRRDQQRPQRVPAAAVPATPTAATTVGLITDDRWRQLITTGTHTHDHLDHTLNYGDKSLCRASPFAAFPVILFICQQNLRHATL
jgi:hypothetical protein